MIKAKRKKEVCWRRRLFLGSEKEKEEYWTMRSIDQLIAGGVDETQEP